jgi:hypothetical protein
MKVPIISDGLSHDHGGSPRRPVSRVKRSLATSLCAAASTSWAEAHRAGGPYAYARDCFCLSPEQHGAQFRQEGLELRPLKGQC